MRRTSRNRRATVSLKRLNKVFERSEASLVHSLPIQKTGPRPQMEENKRAHLRSSTSASRSWREPKGSRRIGTTVGT